MRYFLVVGLHSWQFVSFCEAREQFFQQCLFCPVGCTGIKGKGGPFPRELELVSLAELFPGNGSLRWHRSRHIRVRIFGVWSKSVSGAGNSNPCQSNPQVPSLEEPTAELCET